MEPRELYRVLEEQYFGDTQREQRELERLPELLQDVKVFVDAVEAINVNRVNCQTVEIPTTVGTPTSIEIRNVQPGGTLSVSWLLPPPMPPTGVSVN